MNYAVIKKNDIANGVGVRVSLFVSGCRHRCKNCFNKEAWDFNYGEKYTEEIAKEILEAIDHDFVAGLSFLGGEPFEPENQADLLKLAKQFNARFPDKNLWVYTGFLFEDILAGKVGDKDTATALLREIDVLVDGKFVENLKDASLLFRGSSNQRIIDVKKSLTKGEVVWCEGKWQRKMGSGDINE